MNALLLTCARDRVASVLRCAAETHAGNDSQRLLQTSWLSAADLVDASNDTSARAQSRDLHANDLQLQLVVQRLMRNCGGASRKQQQPSASKAAPATRTLHCALLCFSSFSVGFWARLLSFDELPCCVCLGCELAQSDSQITAWFSRSPSAFQKPRGHPTRSRISTSA